MDCLTVPSTIDEVTVYRQGALVHRIAELKRDNGSFPEDILLEGLPACLQDDSVRVKLSAPDGSTAPIAGDLKIQLLIADNKDKVEPDKGRVDKLNALRDEQNALHEMLSAVCQSINRLDVDIPERPKPEDAKEPMPSPTAACLELTTFIQEERQTLRDRKRDIEKELTELGEKIAHLEFEIEQENQDPEISEQELTKGIAIRLRETKASATRVSVSIEYMVPGAQWSPSYSLRVDGEKAEATLDMRALVAQATGENWEGVNLKLSTALPQQWTELPELQSLRIGRRQSAPPKKGWRAPPEGAEALFGDYEAFMSSVKSAQAPTEDLLGSGMFDSLIDEETDDLCADEYLKEEAIDFEIAAEEPEMMRLSAPPPARSSGGAPSAPAPCAAPAPKPAMKSKKRSAPRGGMALSASAFEGGGAAGAKMDDMDMMLELPGETTYAGDLMNYAGLRLAGPGGSRRGKLEISSAPPYGAVPGTALETMRRATRAARNLPGLPNRHSLPDSHKGYDYSYNCGTPVDVPSKCKFTSIPVQVQSIQIDIRYVVVPREASDVFRVAKVTNPWDNPLYSGPVDLYLNGEFFITGTLKFVVPRGKVDLGLGVEEAIKVARNTFFDEESGGMLKGKLSLKHDIKIEAINNLPRAIELEVRERIPVKREDDDDIEITVRDVTPTWKDYKEPPEHLEGRKVWTVNVPAGEKCELKAGYDVHIASKNEVVGGNRREA